MNTNYKIIYKSYIHLIVFFALYITVLLGFYFNEDNLGGAAHDALHHFKIAQRFNEDFYNTLFNYGNSEFDLATRNSPVFWIFISVLNKFFSYEVIRILNSTILFAIGLVFYKCLLLKFKDFNKIYLLILSTIIFLSPSLRSLAIWPYSLIWGLFFFVVSIYFYLKFKNNLNFKNSSKILMFVIFSSYIYPSFSVFYIFYLFKINKENKNTILLLKLIIFSFVLSIPALAYLISTDFINVFKNSQGVETSWKQSLNISNKILIISTMILYFLMPIINLKEIVTKIINTNKYKLLIILLFSFINIYFFDFLDGPWGGGFFYKLSNIIYENNYLFFVSAFISILIIYSLINKNISNYYLIVILILFNPQLTIYIKYFDPLIFILFLTLFDFDLKKHFIDKSYAIYQFYGVILFYFITSYSKNIFF